ncbi:MAG TPA: hypothetical protein VNZ43_09545 [Sphingomonadaceae bacterium]|nr:hypothetical protein [Sphingomonadaceae bacterium]
MTSCLFALAVAIFSIWLLIALLGVALKLIAVLIGVALAVAAYFLAEKLVGKGR